MKVLPALLVVSLATNAVFITVTLRSPATSTTSPSPSPSSSSSRDLAPPPVAASIVGDLQAFRDLLREASVPDATVRNLVSAEVWSRYEAALAALRPQPDARRWRRDPDWSFENMSPAQHTETRRLIRAAKSEIADLLGPDNDHPDWLPIAARLAYLSDAKRAAVREILETHETLAAAVYVDMHGFPLPSDDEKLHRLETEKQRALAAALTPAEIAEYELRMSPLAETLRRQLPLFAPSETEFRQIFALKQASLSSTDFDAQLETALGPQRYRDYLRAHSDDYQKLAALARRLKLPPENAATVYGFKHTASAEALRIADTPDLTLSEKKARLADLAARTRARARSLLGDGEAARLYTETHLHSLKDLEAGHITLYSENGFSTGLRNLNSERPASAPLPSR